MSRLDELLQRFNGFIFDLDGTLVDSSYVWSDIDERFLSERGFKVPDDYAQKIASLGFVNGAVYTINRFGLNESVEDIVAEWHNMALYEYEHNVPLKSGVLELLKRVKDCGKKMAIATASNEVLCTAVLKSNRVYNLFDELAYVDEVCRSKKFPDVYILAAGKLGCRVQDCIVFEDVYDSAKAAKDAGFYVVTISNGSNEEARQGLMSISDITVDSLDELL